MARNLINRYVWLVDTISRYGRITLKDLNAAWLRSEISEGKPLARRTFFHYRDGVEEMFDINIKCDKATFEYYIDDKDGEDNARLRSWLVDSVSMSGTLSNARDISNLIRETYGGKLKVFATDMPLSIRAAEISSEGKSIYAHDPKGKVAAAYKELTKEVLHDEKQRQRQKHQSDLLR